MLTAEHVFYIICNGNQPELELTEDDITGVTKGTTLECYGSCSEEVAPMPWKTSPNITEEV